MEENVSPYELIADSAEALHLDLKISEFTYLAEKFSFSEGEIQSVAETLRYLRDKKKATVIATLFKMSRLPQKEKKTFQNYDFARIKGKDVEKLRNLPTLSAIYAHKNLIFIGPAGVGKTHLAQAFGYECCMRGMKTYFIKMSELNEKFTRARQVGKVGAALNGLVRPSCLIIDEVGHCKFDEANTRLFFDLIDRRYNKEGAFNTIFTSNKNPAEWKHCFNEDDSLLCALDRIFDTATVFTIKGESFRGRKLERVSLTSSSQPDSGSSEIPNL